MIKLEWLLHKNPQSIINIVNLLFMRTAQLRYKISLTVIYEEM